MLNKNVSSKLPMDHKIPDAYIPHSFNSNIYMFTFMYLFQRRKQENEEEKPNQILKSVRETPDVEYFLKYEV